MNDRRVPVFAANWKMFKGPSETRAFVSAFARIHEPREDARVLIFPPRDQSPRLRGGGR